MLFLFYLFLCIFSNPKREALSHEGCNLVPEIKENNKRIKQSQYSESEFEPNKRKIEDLNNESSIENIHIYRSFPQGHVLPHPLEASTLPPATSSTPIPSTSIPTTSTIHIYRSFPQSLVLPKLLDRTGWIADANSYAGKEPPSQAIDGNINTNWHSYWDSDGDSLQSPEGEPFYFILNLRRPQRIGAFSLLPRQKDNAGKITAFEVYVGNDDNETRQNALNHLNPVASGNIDYGSDDSSTDWVYIDLDEPQVGQYFCLLAVSGVEDYASIAEINLYDDSFLNEISRSNWTAFSTPETTGTSNTADKTIDDDSNSYWESTSESGNKLLYFNLGKKERFGSFSYQPRSNLEGSSEIEEYKIFIGNSVDNLTTNIENDNYVHSGRFYYRNSESISKLVYLEKEQYSQYVGILSSKNVVSCSEFRLYRRYLGCLDRSGWNITTNSQNADVGGNEGPIEYLIDGNPYTHWHSDYSGNSTQAQDFPYRFIIDLGQKQKINGFSIFVRQDGNELNRVVDYKIYVGKSISHLETRMNEGGGYYYSGQFDYNELATSGRYYKFTNVFDTQYVGLLITSSTGDQRHVASSEFYLYYNSNSIAELNNEFVDRDNLPLAISNNIIQVSTNSQSAGGGIRYIIDGNIDLAWGSYISSSSGSDTPINDVVFDEPILAIFSFSNNNQRISSFCYYPGRTASGKDFEIYIGENETDIRDKARRKEYECCGTFREVKEYQYYNLKSTVTCKSFAIGFRSYSSDQATCGEISLYSEFIHLSSQGEYVPCLEYDSTQASSLMAIDNNSITVYTNSQSEGGAAYYANDENEEFAYATFQIDNQDSPRDPNINDVNGDEAILLIYEFSTPQNISSFSYIHKSGFVFRDFEIYLGGSIEYIREQAHNHNSNYYCNYCSY